MSYIRPDNYNGHEKAYFRTNMSRVIIQYVENHKWPMSASVIVQVRR